MMHWGHVVVVTFPRHIRFAIRLKPDRRRVSILSRANQVFMEDISLSMKAQDIK